MLTALLSHWQFGADFTNSVITSNWIRWSASEWLSSDRITLLALNLCCLWYGVRLVVEWKSNWSFVDIVLNFTFVCFGADFTNSVLGGAELGEVLASVINEFSDSMSSQLILPALYLSSQGPYNLNLMSRQVDPTTACTGLWRDPSNYNGYPFVVQC